MSDDNKWSKPDAPPPPLFLGKKERDLVKQINDELVEKVIYHPSEYMRLLSSQITLRTIWKVPELINLGKL